MSANTHHTKLKGDTSVAAVIFDLTKKGYIISEPMSENAPYDLICDTGTELLRIQVKYRANGIVPYKNSWSDKNGNHFNIIDTSKIDYFAIVNENFDKIIYPPSEMAGCIIRFELPKGFLKHHWWEDYLVFHKERQPMRQKICDKSVLSKNQIRQKRFKPEVIVKMDANPIVKKTKIKWPTSEEMTNLVYQKPTQVLAKELGVSDVAIAKYCKKHGIAKPPRGYWAKQKKL